MLESRVREFLSKHPEITLGEDGKYSVKCSKYKVSLPTEFSSALCRLLGLIHGDGNMSFKRIHITDKCPEFHKKYIKPLFEEVFGVAPNYFFDKNRNSGYSHLKCSVIYKYLTEVLEVPGGPVRANLKLPSYITTLEDNLQYSYVAGLYDAESHVKKRQAEIDFSTTNKEIFEYIQKILSQLKISFGVYTRNRYANKEYEIHIYGKNNLQIFTSNIKICHPDKIDRLNRFLPTH